MIMNKSLLCNLSIVLSFMVFTVLLSIYVRYWNQDDVNPCINYETFCECSGERLSNDEVLIDILNRNVVGPEKIFVYDGPGSASRYPQTLWETASEYLKDYPDCCSLYEGNGLDQFLPAESVVGLGSEQARVFRVSLPHLELQDGTHQLIFVNKFIFVNKCGDEIYDSNVQ